MIYAKRSTFSSYLTQLLSRGQVVFSDADARAALGIGRGALLDAAERQQRRKNLIKPRRGFYVIVPPQFLAWGAPPPSWYIDALMAHAKRPYYVALLKAAELHGATHQAVMQFQVVTDRQLAEIRAGRSDIVFHYRKDMGAVADGVRDHKTDTGSMKISGIELTAFDLLRYPRAAGGLDRIVTVLADLGDGLDSRKLAKLSGAFERSVGQRLGHLLDRLGYGQCANDLHEALWKDRPFLWTELDPAQASNPGFSPEPVERDDRWRVKVRRAPEPDE